ncbi:hypothetical protein [Desulfovibrio psychrotolerans]|uniref:Uncharacterized protein n=1 Tax=Desulfovibrio psychrotolerans TaxID=415242 RepID=A0A7J0BS29_9BACT|nr:hypothetical protein [Desulfovibrio psychrotolerans]GFM36523.1 hypothetical protein DSM19430T_12070 [Desulfovibrio psychrotolerans]
MRIASMAKSPLRQMRYADDVEAFRLARGGHLGGTMHCARYLGTRILWDAATEEFISPEGVVVPGLDHLTAELRMVRDRGLAAFGSALPPHCGGRGAGEGFGESDGEGAGQISGESAGDAAGGGSGNSAATPAACVPDVGGVGGMDGVLIPVQQGLPHFRIYDVFSGQSEAAPTGSEGADAGNMTLWRQINLLADMFAELDSKTVYTRPVQYFHTPSLDSEKRVTRWLKNWTTRPGCGGVYFKEMEFVYQPNRTAQGACVVRGRVR